MPAFSAASSSASVAIASFADAMPASWSEILRPRPFFLSSVASNCAAQYSFLWSSSSCSCFSVATISSIIVRTLSKPTFWPRSASRMRSMRERSPAPALRAFETSAEARARRLASLIRSCTKLALALGSVFLNRSSASSSFSTLIVSARATISMARVCFCAANSAPLVLQFFSRSARNLMSSSRPSAVSPASAFSVSILTPRSPTRCSFVSIIFESAATSFFLAAMSSSYTLMAASSVAVASARPFDSSSPSCFRMPAIWPLCGA
mmetsp:Transcript_113150/g.156212  ORF Transcript_113150/g.156212 Transcript_113150/m.156212 type:complete len:265 (+) Transcript_113150:310-1104(+)